jgi:hypothetical protein
MSETISANPQPLGTIPGASPAEGPKTLPLTLNFTNSVNQFVLQTQQLLYSGAMSSLQSAIVNNTENSEPVTITVSISGNVITIPAGAMQTVTLLAPSMSTLTFASTGVAVVTVQITNFFIQPTGGNSSGGSGTYSGGALVVTDATLDACVASNRLRTLDNANSSGDVPIPRFVGNNYYTGQINAGGANYHTIATGSPYFCITGIIIGISSNLAFSGDPQNIEIGIYDGSNLIVKTTINTGLNATRQQLTILSLTGLEVYTTTSGGQINISCGTVSTGLAPSTGYIYATIFGGVTAT